MSTGREKRQAEEYAFPYHHLPHLDLAGRPRLGRAMRGGMEYLAYTYAVADVVRGLRPSTVLDVGCGDGRLLLELDRLTDSVTGIDLDERALSFARSFAPGAHVEMSPVAAVPDRYDVVTCIETIEHIPDEGVGEFILQLGDRVAVEGHLILTVPSTARPRIAKHYRHYDVSLVKSTIAQLPGRWAVQRLEEIVPSHRLMDRALALVSNRYWTFDATFLNRAVLEVQRRPVRPGRRGLHVLALLQRKA